MWASQLPTPPPRSPTKKDNNNNNNQRRRPSVDTTVTSISELIPLTPPPPPLRHRQQKAQVETTRRIRNATTTNTTSSMLSGVSFTGLRSSSSSSGDGSSTSRQPRRRPLLRQQSQSRSLTIDNNHDTMLFLSSKSPTSSTDISHLYPIVTDLDDLGDSTSCGFRENVTKNKESCSSTPTSITSSPPVVLWDHHHHHPDAKELRYDNNGQYTTSLPLLPATAGAICAAAPASAIPALKLPSTLQLCHHDATSDVGMIRKRATFPSCGKSSRQQQQTSPSLLPRITGRSSLAVSEGDTATATTWQLFESTMSSCSSFDMDEIPSVPPRRHFDALYVLTRLIFQYDQSSVWECVHRVSGQRYCVKILENNATAAHNEVSMLQAAQSHDNSIALIEVLCDDDDNDVDSLILSLPSFDDVVPLFHSSHPSSITSVATAANPPKRGKIYMIMEWMSGGNLLSYVVQQQHEQGSHHTTTSGAQHHHRSISSSRSRQRQPCRGLDERSVQIIAVQLLRAIQHLHTVAFVHHNNLHPANILLGASWDDAIKVADFGSATPQDYNDHSGSPTTASVDSCDAQDSVVLDRNPSYESSTSRATRTRTSSIDVEMLAPHSFASRARTYPELKRSPAGVTTSSRSRRRKRPPGAASDIRSVGRILQFCLFGVNEFNDTSSSALSGGDATFNQGGIEVSFVRHRGNKDIPYQYSHVSRHCKQFLNGILHKDPSIRLTLDEALSHPWLTEFVAWEPKQSSIAFPISLPISPPSISSTLPESSTRVSGRCQVAVDFITKKGSSHGIVQSGLWSVARIWDFLYRRTTCHGEVNHPLPPSNTR